jgi:hypothetical protein
MKAWQSWLPETAKICKSIGAQNLPLYSEGATLFSAVDLSIVPTPDIWFLRDDGNGNRESAFFLFNPSTTRLNPIVTKSGSETTAPPSVSSPPSTGV